MGPSVQSPPPPPLCRRGGGGVNFQDIHEEPMITPKGGISGSMANLLAGVGKSAKILDGNLTPGNSGLRLFLKEGGVDF